MKFGDLKIYFFPDGQESYDPSSRYRCFNIYKEFLKNNVDCVFIESPFDASFDFYGFFKKIFTIAKITLVRHYNLIKVALNLDRKKNNILFFQRGLNIGTVNLALFLRFIYKFKIVFDFDDAIFHVNFMTKRVDKFIKSCNMVVVGSHYLLNYAEKLNKNSYLIPTSLDLQHKYASKKEQSHFGGRPIRIGWIGSFYNVKYLNLLVEPLKNLVKKYPLELIIIGPDKKFDIPFDKAIKINHIVWNAKTEISDLLKIDIGVMPLFDSKFERGKCAFKAIQYMALGIPTVASSIGENNYLIKNWDNGFLAGNSKEWQERIEEIILNLDLRNKFSLNAKKRIMDNYSLNKNSLKLLNIINKKLLNKNL